MNDAGTCLGGDLGKYRKQHSIDRSLFSSCDISLDYPLMLDLFNWNSSLPNFITDRGLIYLTTPLETFS